MFNKCTEWKTRDGHDATVVCDEIMTVYHAVNGGKLYTHDPVTGCVTSSTVSNDYDLVENSVLATAQKEFAEEKFRQKVDEAG